MMYRILLAAVVLTAVFAAGCQNTANSNAANRPANATNVNSANADKTPDKPATELSQATPTDAYKTAWAVRDRKDVAGMKKVLSKDILDFLTEMGKGDGKSLDDEIKAIFEKPQAKTAEARNEKITGDEATIEYLNENGEWKTMEFVKENGVWKMALGKMDQLEKKINEGNKK